MFASCKAFSVLLLVSLCTFELLRASAESEPHTLYVGLFAPYPDDFFGNDLIGWIGGASMTPGALLAIDEINNRSDILKGYRLEPIVVDSGCSLTSKADIGLVNTVFQSERQVVGLVGPGCSGAAISNAPIVSRPSVKLFQFTVATSVQLADAARYPYTFRSVSSSGAYVDLYLDMIELKKWNNVVVLYDSNRLYYSSTYNVFRERLEARYTSKGLDSPVVYTSGITTDYFPLQEIKASDSRVILAFIGGPLLSKLLCAMYWEEMTFPTYQWIFHDRSVHEFVNKTEDMNFDHDSCPDGHCHCTQKQINQTLNGNIFNLFILSVSNDTYLDGPRKTFKQFFEEYVVYVQRHLNELGLTDVIDYLFGPPFYDALWALALGLNNSMENLNVSLADYWPTQNNTDLTDIIRESVYDLEFQGATGNVQFNRETNGVPTTIEIYSWHYNSTRENPQIEQRLQGRYDNADGFKNFSKTILISDTFTVHEVKIHTGAAVTVYICVGVALVLVLFFHFLNTFYRRYNSFRATSPRMNHIIFTGCYMIIVAIILCTTVYSFKVDDYEDDTATVRNNTNSTDVGETDEGFDVQGFLCNVFTWNIVIGYTLIFGTICSKSWRVYRIFTQTFSAPDLRTADKYLIIFVAVVLVVDLFILIPWSVVDPYYTDDVVNIVESDGVPIRSVVRQCRCKYELFWLGAVAIYLGVMIVSVLYFSIMTRRVRSRFKFTKTVNGLICSLAILVGLDMSLYVVMRVTNSFEGIFASVCVMLLGSLYLFVVFLFLPPLLPFFAEKSREARKPSIVSFLSNEPME